MQITHIRRAARWAVVALMAGSVGLLGGSAGAQTATCGSGAGTYPPTAGNLQLSVTHDVPVTGTVTVSGSGFSPGTTVQLSPQGLTPGTAPVDAAGSFSVTVTLPAGTLAGNAVITATGSGSGGCLRETAQFTTSVLGTSQAQALHLVGHSATLKPGETVTIGANGCGPSTPVRFYIDSTDIAIGQTTSDAQGAFTGTITIPTNTVPGAHNILSICEDPLTLSLAITVVADGSQPLPVTGANVRPLLLAVVVLMALGALLLLVGRRSRKRRGQP